MNEGYKLELVSNKPIILDDIIIYQPTIDEILDLGMKEYEKFLLPYLATIDMLNIAEEQKKTIKNFDLLFARVSENQMLLTYKEEDQDIPISYSEILYKSLCFFCKTSVEFIKEEVIFKIGEGTLDRNNFDEFANIILEMACREKPTIEKEPEFKNDRQRDIWVKLQEGRKRNAKNEEINFPTIIKNVKFGGKNYISSSEIKKMTMWELIDAYKSILQIDNYYTNFKMYLVGVELKDLDLTHWSKQLKM